MRLNKALVFRIIQSALSGITALSFFAAVHSDTRKSIRDFVFKDYRRVLSTAQVKLNKIDVTIAKIRTTDALFLEIYELLPGGGSKLIKKIDLPDSRDGYFSFNGRATNLAVDDINDDGELEILAPTFDNNLVGHLNVYSLDAELNSFEPIMR